MSMRRFLPVPGIPAPEYARRQANCPVSLSGLLTGATDIDRAAAPGTLLENFRRP